MFPIPPELDMSLLLKFIGVDEGTGHFKPLEINVEKEEEGGVDFRKDLLLLR